jgi:hypothetical protein
MESCITCIRSQNLEVLNNEALRLLLKLLSIPLESLSLAILDMNHYPTLMSYLNFGFRKTVSLRIVKAVIKSKKRLDSKDVVTKLIEFITPLLLDGKDTEEGEPYEFEEEQEAVARLPHLVNNADLDEFHSIFLKFK